MKYYVFKTTSLIAKCMSAQTHTLTQQIKLNTSKILKPKPTIKTELHRNLKAIM